ncbi:CBS domain-containing protein [Caenispirillum bisanense]|uniref:CBS domain-containing protein n=1 Tax=Caenispirillum bisanense TaxID=414052 RepID=A0A286G9R0_9PROT|nr:CBS domain-containing protein [Caenispirillum bisanense]SOD92261.1 CBS domain-containing protein [Caenispirillum bisanense]
MLIRSILEAKGTTVATTRSSATVRDAVMTMRELGISALVVSDAERRIDGIVSDRGIIRALADKGVGIMDNPVTEVMTRQVVTCGPEDHVTAVMNLMSERRIRHIPVADGDGLLAGLVSIGDVVKHRIDEIRDEAEHMRDYITNAR